MAYDNDVKIKVRAFYECNNVSMAKVALHFEGLGYEVKKKTMEYWANGEKWKKNKYASMREAVAASLPVEVLDSVSEKVRESIISSMSDDAEGVVSGEIEEDMVEAVTEELIWQQLSKKALIGELAVNLKKTKKIVENSTSMSVKATYHAMVISTIQTVYGKKVEMVPQNPDNIIISDKEADEMSTAELLAILEQ